MSRAGAAGSPDTRRATRLAKREPDSPKIYERGDITKVSSLGVFSVDQIQQMFNTKGADMPFSPKYEVEVLSVSYYSCDENGSLIHVSGAFFIPQTDSDFPLLSIQHGTETKRDLVASVSPNNSTEGSEQALLAGYRLIGHVLKLEIQHRTE